jgi:hypothetical protein
MDEDHEAEAKTLENNCKEVKKFEEIKNIYTIRVKHYQISNLILGIREAAQNYYEKWDENVNLSKISRIGSY